MPDQANSPHPPPDQGQEFLQGDCFDDAVPLDWAQSEDFHGIVRLWRDLIALRLGGADARGLAGRGVEILLCDNASKLLAYRRFEYDEDHGVLVAMNFRSEPQEATFALPQGGVWRLRLNTDWDGYSDEFANHSGGDLNAGESDDDDPRLRATVPVGAYSALVFSR